MKKILVSFVAAIFLLVSVPVQGAPPTLEKKVFIHYKKGPAKPDNPGNGKGKKGETQCYGFLSKGAKLKATENIVIHPDLDSAVILDSLQIWQDNTSTDLFGSSSIDASADWDGDPGDSPDGRNEFSYGNYSQAGVIAITVAWGRFSGPPQNREIMEFDIMFDTDYSWGDADIDPLLMDLKNISVHEVGHGLGLADIYQGDCSAVTMYGYSEEGETQKRTLESADITGLQELYGA